jgi:hypothetical protein
MPMSKSWIAAAAVVTAAAVAALFAASPASAAATKDGDVRVGGRCTGPSTAKLKLSAENGRIEVEFEVDQNRNGVRWTVALRRNGRLAATGVGVTRAPSGSFEFRRVLPNGPGADRIVATARRASGEVCTATAVWRR